MKKQVDIIREEIDKQMKELNIKDPKYMKSALRELFSLKTDNLMTNMGSVENDPKTSLSNDLWDWFIETVSDSITKDSDSWLKSLRETKMAILAYKYFTRNNQIDIDEVEEHVRKNIKPYFTALQNNRDPEDFKNKVFNLPSDVLFSLVRYMFKISPELKKSIVITNKRLGERIKALIGERMKFINDVDQVSQGYKTTLDIKKGFELFDNGLFFEDNMLNRGVNEYINKLLNHQEAFKNLKDLFPSALLKSMKKQTETAPAYIAHLSALKTEQSQPYFTPNGQQIGKRFGNDVDVVKDQEFDGYVIDKNSRLKEPSSSVNQVGGGWQASGGPKGSGAEGGGPGAAGGPGGMGGGSFGGDFSVPSDDESFAPPGSEGEVPGEEDGEDMPKGEDGMPVNFGSKETNDDDEPADILPTPELPEPVNPQGDDKEEDKK